PSAALRRHSATSNTSAAIRSPNQLPLSKDPHTTSALRASASPLRELRVLPSPPPRHSYSPATPRPLPYALARPDPPQDPRCPTFPTPLSPSSSTPSRRKRPPPAAAPSPRPSAPSPPHSAAWSSPTASVKRPSP